MRAVLQHIAACGVVGLEQVVARQQGPVAVQLACDADLPQAGAKGLVQRLNPVAEDVLEPNEHREFQGAGARFLDALGLFTRLVNIGDAKSLVIHPASTTHRQLSEQDQVKAGVPPDMVRLSIGLETLADIIWDIEQALVAAR